MRALTARTAQDGDVAVAVEQSREPLKVRSRWSDDGQRWQQPADLGRRRVGRGLKRDVAGKHHYRNAAIADRLADGDLEGARHLPWFGDEFAIAAAFLE